MNTENKLGKKIKELRKSKGYTQEKVAELANIDAKHLSKIENGVHTPSYNTLKKLSNILNFNLRDIDSETQTENAIIQSPLYGKSLKILNSAKSEKELQNYYDVLKLANRLMNK